MPWLNPTRANLSPDRLRRLSSSSRKAFSFGAASSVVVLLIWVYYSAQIFLIGAEFTWVFAHRFGSKKDEKRELNAPAPEPRRSAQPA